MATLLYQTLTIFFGLIGGISIIRLLVDFMLKRIQKMPRATRRR